MTATMYYESDCYLTAPAGKTIAATAMAARATPTR